MDRSDLDLMTSVTRSPSWAAALGCELLKEREEDWLSAIERMK